jgi:gp16 family phage-associated protein
MKKKSPISQKFYEAGINMSGWARKHGIPEFQIWQIANGANKGTRGRAKKVIEMLKAEGLWADDNDKVA